MTELERILKETLTTIEQEMTANQKTHQKTLEAHGQAIQTLQQSISRMEAEQQQSARHLQRLSAVHASLEPLLSRLNAILNAG